jgi:uncharacterized lipoprotein YmbA
MMRVTLHCVIAIVCLTLASCTSAPVHYFTLLAPAERNDTGSATVDPVPFLIEVLPVDIPPQVDQMQLVVQEGESTVSVLDNERWAAPLNEELRSALSIALVQQLGTQDVNGLPKPVGKPLLRVKLQVRRFESRLGQYVLLDVDWSLALTRDPKQGINNDRLLCHSRLLKPAGGDCVSVVRGHQQTIAALAGHIATAARGWVVSQRSTCPDAGS